MKFLTAMELAGLTLLMAVASPSVHAENPSLGLDVLGRLVLRGVPSVAFENGGTRAIVTTTVDPTRGYELTIGKTGTFHVKTLENYRPSIPTEVTDMETTPAAFFDEQGTVITPLDTSVNYRDQNIDYRRRPQALLARYGDTVERLTPEDASDVRFFAYDPLSQRVLIQSPVGEAYEWYCFDLESKQRRYVDIKTTQDATGHVNFDMEQHYWMIPGEDLLLFFLRRYVWEDELAYRLAVCDLKGNVLGVLPMREYRDNGESLNVFTSQRMTIIGGMRRDIYAFVMAQDTAVRDGQTFLALRPDENLQEMARNCGIDMERMISGLASYPDKNTEPCPALPNVDMVELQNAPDRGTKREHNGGCFISRYEITNAQFAAAINWAKNNGRISALDREGGPTDWGPVCSFDPYMQLPVVEGEIRVRIRDGQSAANLPVLIDDYGAAVFCNALSEMEGRPTCYVIDHANETAELVAPDSGGYRLPTVEEWRAAAGVARGEEPGAAAPWLGDVRERGRRCNCDDNNPLAFRLLPYLTPVGFYNGSSADRIATISPSGCFDMFGNASELCHIDAQTGPLSLTALGGAWDDRETLERKPCGEDGFRIVRCGDQ